MKKKIKLFIHIIHKISTCFFEMLKLMLKNTIKISRFMFLWIADPRKLSDLINSESCEDINEN